MANILHRGAMGWGGEWWRRWARIFEIWSLGLWDRASDPSVLLATGSSSYPVARQQIAPAIGSEPEFAQFFLEFEQSVYGYVRRMVASEESAIDITQDTFFRAWQHFATIRTYERPQAWLYRVATRLALNLHREHSIPFSHHFTHQQAGGDEIPSEIQFVDPLDLEAQTVDRDVIVRALAVLPERDRAALLLRAVHDMTFKEIGVALGLSYVAVRKVLSRARERFRVALVAMEADA